MLTHYLYRHLTKDEGLPFYIGISAFDSNRKPSRAFSHGRNPLWEKIVRKHGRGKTEIMRLFSSRAEANETERFFIKLYGKKKDGGLLSNIADGGDGLVKGDKLPQWWRDRISASVRGPNNSRYGKRPSDEQIQKAIAANTGKPKTAKCKALLSIAQRGVPNPPEQVARHKAWLLSDKNPMRGRKRPGFAALVGRGKHWHAKRVIDKSTGIIYPCIKDAADALKISRGRLSEMARGIIESTLEIYDDGLRTTS